MYTKNLFLASLVIGSIVFQSCGDNSTTKTSETTTTDSNAAPSATAPAEHDMNNMAPGSSSDLMTSMNTSMMRMEEMKQTGDFDFDFAAMMREHHQGAIDMSQVELSKGSDAQVKGWAQKIIDAQKAEIADFDKILSSTKPTAQQAEGGHSHNELHESGEKMQEDMKAMKMTGNVDKDFVMMMVGHHQSAITMAKDELSHGKNIQLKQMAQKIIQDQQAEIKEFQSWLDSHK